MEVLLAINIFSTFSITSLFFFFFKLSSDLIKKCPFIEVTHFATTECSDNLEATELGWQSGHPPRFQASQRPGMLLTGSRAPGGLYGRHLLQYELMFCICTFPQTWVFWNGDG